MSVCVFVFLSLGLPVDVFASVWAILDSSTVFMIHFSFTKWIKPHRPPNPDSQVRFCLTHLRPGEGHALAHIWPDWPTSSVGVRKGKIPLEVGISGEATPGTSAMLRLKGGSDIGQSHTATQQLSWAFHSLPRHLTSLFILPKSEENTIYVMSCHGYYMRQIFVNCSVTMYCA